MISHRLSKPSSIRCITPRGTASWAVASAPMSHIKPRTLFSSTGEKLASFSGKLSHEENNYDSAKIENDEGFQRETLKQANSESVIYY